MTASRASARYEEDRTVRVFVSSTFKDMQRERDYLVKHVFPRLRALAAQRGASFVEIDLRWGITSEQAAEGAVLPICLAEIERSRPFFLGILGERYGWVPDAIPDELLALQPWLREHQSRSVTELEIVHGVLDDPSMAPYAFFYFRDPNTSRSAGGAEPMDTVESDPSRAARLTDLKQRIREAPVTVREGFATPADLGEAVWEDLSAAIDRRFPAESTPDPLTRARNIHQAFARDLAQVYVGGESCIGRLDKHALGGSSVLLVVGESGSGKSALISRWYTEAVRHSDNARAHAGKTDGADDLWAYVDVLAHFVGVDRESTSLAQTLRRLVLEIASMYDILVDASPDEAALAGSFARVLNLVPRERRLVIAIDAVNQLEASGLPVTSEWLPTRLPGNVCLILSTMQADDSHSDTPSDAQVLTIQPLTEDIRSELTAAYLGRYGKSLESGQVARIAGAKQGELPIFLITLLDELRVFGSHDELNNRITRYLRAPDTASLLDLVLARWESDYEASAPGLVGRTMQALWAARQGLTEDQLLAALGESGEPLPQALFAPLRLASGRALAARAGKLGIAHEHLRQAVGRRYLPTPESQRHAHGRLASFYIERGERRELADIAWQLEQAQDWSELAARFSSLDDIVGAWQADPSVTASAWRALQQRGVSLAAAFDHCAEEPSGCGDGVAVLAALARSIDEQAFAGRLARACAAHAVPDSAQLRISVLRNGASALSAIGDTDTALKLLEQAEELARGTWAHRPYLHVVLDRARVLAASGACAVAREEYEFVASAAWLTYDERLLKAAQEGWRIACRDGQVEP